MLPRGEERSRTDEDLLLHQTRNTETPWARHYHPRRSQTHVHTHTYTHTYTSRWPLTLARTLTLPGVGEASEDLVREAPRLETILPKLCPTGRAALTTLLNTCNTRNTVTQPSHTVFTTLSIVIKEALITNTSRAGVPLGGLQSLSHVTFDWLCRICCSVATVPVPGSRTIEIHLSPLLPFITNQADI